MGKWAEKKSYRSFLFLAVILCGILFYQNCSDTTLLGAMRLGSVGGGAMVSKLPTPENNMHDIRVMVFVDQSYSMIYGKCKSDLDGSTPSIIAPACPNPEAGIDPAAHRY